MSLVNKVLSYFWLKEKRSIRRNWVNNQYLVKNNVLVFVQKTVVIIPVSHISASTWLSNENNPEVLRHSGQQKKTIFKNYFLHWDYSEATYFRRIYIKCYVPSLITFTFIRHTSYWQHSSASLFTVSIFKINPESDHFIPSS